jgi:Domain of unknown function (DUF5060)/Putative collagen-binding domain of a collagenase/Secretion system C-terminal sorting domain/Dockerin type I domain
MRLDRSSFFAAYLGLALFCAALTPASAYEPVPAVAGQMAVVVTGELKLYHPITITLDGPTADEGGTPNPFSDYRFEVVFSQAELSITVPGYFAADGNAAETGATSGNKWRAHFIPPRTGTWTYRTSFRQGTDAALSTSTTGTVLADYDDIFGSFSISVTDKTGPDHRAKGKLRYLGERYLRYDDGEYFIKGGTDSPENFLAYEEFDQTFNYAGTDFIKSYSDHVVDWQAGDPTWKGGKGKGIIGAVNYLGNKGMNSIYFITMNIQGDGEDVWPWVSPTSRTRFDVSKLAQWDIVFSQMDKKGIMLHVVTQETENELLLNGGALGRERKLYYRELIARFGYHHAITWNLGEENNETTTTQRKEFAAFIRSFDPYDHPIVIHTFPGEYDAVYGPLLGSTSFEGASLQTGKPENTHDLTLEWVNKANAEGRPWYVTMDENGPWEDGATPDGTGNNHDLIRTEVLWGNYMAGGGGVEWYFGFEHPNNDLDAESWKTRENVWAFTKHALDFFRAYLPFPQMASNDALASNANAYVLAKAGETYAVYLKTGGTTNLNITGASATYTVKWYNPRTGGSLKDGTVKTVNGPGNPSIGQPPSETTKDWVALVSTDAPQTPLIGDASLDGTISALDASLILQHAIGLITLPSAAIPLADASGNGEIIAFDASLVLQYVANLRTCFPAEAGCSAGKSGREAKLRSVAFGAPVRGPGNAYTVPILLDAGASSIASVQLEVRYDASRLRFVGARGIAGWEVLQNDRPGHLSIAAAGLPAVLDGESIFLQFEPLAPGLPVLDATIAVDELAPMRILSDAEPSVPDAFTLEANYPNPFNPSTVIRYALPEASAVRLEVFDLTGRSVAVLMDGPQAAGVHEVVFDAASLPSGVYLYRIKAGTFLKTMRMTLVR